MSLLDKYNLRLFKYILYIKEEFKQLNLICIVSYIEKYDFCLKFKFFLNIENIKTFIFSEKMIQMKYFTK